MHSEAHGRKTKQKNYKNREEVERSLDSPQTCHDVFVVETHLKPSASAIPLSDVGFILLCGVRRGSVLSLLWLLFLLLLWVIYRHFDVRPSDAWPISPMPKVEEASLGWHRATLSLHLSLDQLSCVWMEIELDAERTKPKKKTKQKQKQQKRQQQRENHEIIVHDDVQYIIHSHWTPAPGAVDLKEHCTNPFDYTEKKSGVCYWTGVSFTR